jgi:hypothetical protein
MKRAASEDEDGFKRQRSEENSQGQQMSVRICHLT